MNAKPDLAAMERTVEFLMAQSLAMSAVIRVLTANHPNPPALQQAAPRALEYLRTQLLQSPFSDATNQRAEETLQALLGMPR
jgi:methyltransferase-like protein